jgi:hypothetical protein
MNQLTIKQTLDYLLKNSNTFVIKEDNLVKWAADTGFEQGTFRELLAHFKTLYPRMILMPLSDQRWAIHTQEDLTMFRLKFSQYL